MAGKIGRPQKKFGRRLPVSHGRGTSDQRRAGDVRTKASGGRQSPDGGGSPLAPISREHTTVRHGPRQQVGCTKPVGSHGVDGRHRGTDVPRSPGWMDASGDGRHPLTGGKRPQRAREALRRLRAACLRAFALAGRYAFSICSASRYRFLGCGSMARRMTAINCGCTRPRRR